MHLTDCHKASIYTTDNQYLCDASVSELTEDSAELVFSGSSADILRSEVVVTFYDSFEGLLSYECRLSDYKEYLSAPGERMSRVTCSIGKNISVIQRRKDLKVPVNIETVLTYLDSEGHSRESRARLRNISAGGVFLTCRTRFLPGQLFHFPLKTADRFLKMSAEILRIEPPSVEDAPPGYGCRFVDLPPYAEASLRNFVYRQELLIRKR